MLPPEPLEPAPPASASPAPRAAVSGACGYLVPVATGDPGRPGSAPPFSGGRPGAPRRVQAADRPDGHRLRGPPCRSPSPRAAPAAQPLSGPGSGPDLQPAVPAAEPARGPVLPVPPRDDEKYRYVRRGAWLLTLASAASFPLLLFSQTRLMLQFHWFWFYVPFVIMGALFLALPLITDALARGFDFSEHQRLVGGLAPEDVSLGLRLPPSLRGTRGRGP